MSSATESAAARRLKEPKNLSSRIQWLRDYYFQGTERAWNNEFTPWTTGTPWDVQFNETVYYIVPETYMLLQTLRGSFRQSARTVVLHDDFWKWSLPERRAWFVKEVMTRYVPREILPGDLIAGAFPFAAKSFARALGGLISLTVSGKYPPADRDEGRERE